MCFLMAVLVGCEETTQKQTQLRPVISPRIGIAGIAIENSVFMPNRQALVGRPQSLPNYLSPDSAMGKAAIWLPALAGGGGGRGPVTRESYEAFVNDALEIIKSNMPLFPLDPDMPDPELNVVFVPSAKYLYGR